MGARTRWALALLATMFAAPAAAQQAPPGQLRIGVQAMLARPAR